MEGRASRSRRNPLLGAAVVKAVLRKQGAGSGGALYEGLLRDLDLTDEEVERFLREHPEQVEAALLGQGRRS